MDISPYVAPARIIAPQADAASQKVFSAAAAPVDHKLMNSCRQFEGQFFDMMLQEMRKTVPDDPMLGDDAHEQQLFQGMMDDDIAQDMAKHAGANDLAAQMYAQLSRKNASPQAAAPRALAAAVVAPIPASARPEPQAALKKLPGISDNLSNYDAATDDSISAPRADAQR